MIKRVFTSDNRRAVRVSRHQSTTITSREHLRTGRPHPVWASNGGVAPRRRVRFITAARAACVSRQTVCKRGGTAFAPRHYHKHAGGAHRAQNSRPRQPPVFVARSSRRGGRIPRDAWRDDPGGCLARWRFRFLWVRHRCARVADTWCTAARRGPSSERCSPSAPRMACDVHGGHPCDYRHRFDAI